MRRSIQMIHWILALGSIFAVLHPALGMEDLSGEWRTQEGSVLRIYNHPDEYIAYVRKAYVNEYGEYLGDIEYSYAFAKQAQQAGQKLRWEGKLRTYDSFNGCAFENGTATLTQRADNQLVLFSPIINFKVVRRTPSEIRYRFRPYYCHYGYSEYICGWRRSRVIESVGGGRRSCVETGKFLVGTDLYRAAK